MKNTSLDATNQSPLLLVGSERSGTTLLRLMLSHHPKISWCFEFEYSVDWITDEGEFPDLEQYYEFLEIDRIFRMTEFKINRNLTYPQLMNSFLSQWRERDNKELIGATVHRHFDRALNIWPDARFIHILRDPRDVARSCIQMGWAGNTWKGVERWIEAEQIWNKLKTKLKPDQYIEITYENLIAQPPEVLAQICNFMGVEYDEAMLNYPHDTTYKFPNAKLKYQWKHKLSQKEIQLVESRAGDLLEEKGYELSGFPLISLNPIQIKQLEIENWFKCFYFRYQRYGFRLFIEDYISRKLKVKPWQNQVKLKLNDIDASYIA